MTSLPAVSVPVESVNLAGPSVMPAAEAGMVSNPAVASAEGFADVLGLCLPPANPPAPAVAATAAATVSRPLENPPVVPEPAPAGVTASRSLHLAKPAREASVPAVSSEEEEPVDVSTGRPDAEPTVVPVELLAQAVVVVAPLAPVPPATPSPVSGTYEANPSLVGEGSRRRPAVMSGQASTDTAALPARNETPDTAPVAEAVDKTGIPAAKPLPGQPLGAPAESSDETLLPRSPVRESSTPTSPVATAVASAAPEGIAAKIPVPATPATAVTVSAEKIAASPSVTASASRSLTIESEKNKFLISDKKGDTNVSQVAGIVNAKSSPTMRSNLPASPMESAVKPVQGADESLAVAAAQNRIGGGAGDLSPVDDTPSLKISGHAIDAAGAVREVVELTHEFRARERSSVEVNFDFKDDTQLSVRVALRNGDVQATFRTDSAELRATLSREWHGQAAVIAHETRGFHVAEPVFTSSGDFSDASSNRQSGFSTGDDARRQGDPSQSDGSASRRTAFPADAARSRSSSTVLPAATLLRPSTDRLLQAFA
jgi:hypothetical protein